jgi:RNAse (barnase) inhibitor barstar
MKGINGTAKRPLTSLSWVVISGWGHLPVYIKFKNVVFDFLKHGQAAPVLLEAFFRGREAFVAKCS